MAESKGIFSGIDDLIDEALHVKHVGTRSPHYQHKQACLDLTPSPTGFNSHSSLVEKLYVRIEANWKKRTASGYGKTRPSEENWRLELQTAIANKNKSKETKLERGIARIAQAKHDKDWLANQVPVASGLLGSREDKRCAVDLVRRCWAHAGGECYALIELKVASDTPLYAAFEVLRYGLVYLFSRHHAKELGYTPATLPRLLRAQSIHLRVLAPIAEFYQLYAPDALDALARLECDLNAAIGSFARKTVKMDFAFHAFAYSWPLPNDTDLLRCLEQTWQPYAIQTAPSIVNGPGSKIGGSSKR